MGACLSSDVRGSEQLQHSTQEIERLSTVSAVDEYQALPPDNQAPSTQSGGKGSAVGSPSPILCSALEDMATDAGPIVPQVHDQPCSPVRGGLLSQSYYCYGGGAGSQRYGSCTHKTLPLQITRLLSAGSSSSVYEGVLLNRTVAIKRTILAAGMSQRERQEHCSLLEATIITSQHHPNMTRLYSYMLRPHDDTIDWKGGYIYGMEDHRGSHSQQKLWMDSVEAIDNNDDSKSAPVRIMERWEVLVVMEFCSGCSLKDMLNGTRPVPSFTVSDLLGGIPVDCKGDGKVDPSQAASTFSDKDALFTSWPAIGVTCQGSASECQRSPSRLGVADKTRRQSSLLPARGLWPEKGIYVRTQASLSGSNSESLSPMHRASTRSLGLDTECPEPKASDLEIRKRQLIQVLLLAVDISRALEYLHRRETTHGRLCPSNVLLKRVGHNKLSTTSDHGSPNPSRLWPPVDLEKGDKNLSVANLTQMFGDSSHLPTSLQLTPYAHSAQISASNTSFLSSSSQPSMRVVPHAPTQRDHIAKVINFGLGSASTFLGFGAQNVAAVLEDCMSGHLAPEVVQHGKWSSAADVYSLGILLWELYMGKVWQNEPSSYDQALQQHAEILRPCFPPDCPLEYMLLATRCWESDCSIRPPVGQVTEELQRMLYKSLKHEVVEFSSAVSEGALRSGELESPLLKLPHRWHTPGVPQAFARQAKRAHLSSQGFSTEHSSNHSLDNKEQAHKSAQKEGTPSSAQASMQLAPMEENPFDSDISRDPKSCPIVPSSLCTTQSSDAELYQVSDSANAQAFSSPLSVVQEVSGSVFSGDMVDMSRGSSFISMCDPTECKDVVIDLNDLDLHRSLSQLATSNLGEGQGGEGELFITGGVEGEASFTIPILDFIESSDNSSGSCSSVARYMFQNLDEPGSPGSSECSYHSSDCSYHSSECSYHSDTDGEEHVMLDPSDESNSDSDRAGLLVAVDEPEEIEEVDSDHQAERKMHAALRSSSPSIMYGALERLISEDSSTKPVRMNKSSPKASSARTDLNVRRGSSSSLGKSDSGSEFLMVSLPAGGWAQPSPPALSLIKGVMERSSSAGELPGEGGRATGAIDWLNSAEGVEVVRDHRTHMKCLTTISEGYTPSASPNNTGSLVQLQGSSHSVDPPTMKIGDDSEQDRNIAMATELDKLRATIMAASDLYG